MSVGTILLSAVVAVTAMGCIVSAPAQERPAFWIDMTLGEPVSSGEMLEDLVEVDVIYLGETLLLVHMTMEKGFLRNVFEAQATRDESMAAALEMAWSDAVGKADGKKPLAVVVCGAGHCRFGLGTPDRVRRRLGEMRDRIVLMSESGDLELTEAEKAIRRDIEIRHRDFEFIRRPLADYLHAVQPKPQEAGE